MKQVIAVSLALWVASSASASTNLVHVATQITGLQLQVLDLTPGDGVEATVTPYLPYGPDMGPTMSTSLYDYKSNGESNDLQQNFYGSAFDSSEININNEHSSIVKNNSGIYVDTDLTTLSANSLLGTFEMNSGSDQYLTVGAGIGPSNWLALTVSAHTAVNFSADVSHSIELDISQLVGSPQLQPFLNAGYSLALNAGAGFDVTHSDFIGFSDPHYNYASNYKFLETMIDPFGKVIQNEPINQTEKLELTFSNDSDVDVVRYFSLSGGIGYSLTAIAPVASVDVPAVPEPSTYALMAIGLVGIGVVARRSRLTTDGCTA